MKLDKFEELLAECCKVLLKNDCTTNNADKLVADFREAMAPHFKSLSEGEVKQRLYLGYNGLKEEKFTEARETIRDVELIKDAKWDAKMYATRIGLLNSLVNPRQCEKLMAEIERKAKAFLESEDYEGLRDYEKNYPYVHDTYQHILDAFDCNHDFAALEKALQELQQAYVEQHYNEDAAKAASDLDMCEWNGKLVCLYSWGNQRGCEFSALAEANCTEKEFFESFFD